MARFLVVVLDGFGVGVMEDYADFNPQDRGIAHTFKEHFKICARSQFANIGSVGFDEYCRI